MTVVRPAVELEALVPGSWYINAVATLEPYRGRGVGTRLMVLAEDLAMQAGAGVLSLIVAERNPAAKRLYEKLGYQAVATRSAARLPVFPHGGDWTLMAREIG